MRSPGDQQAHCDKEKGTPLTLAAVRMRHIQVMPWGIKHTAFL